MGWENAKDTENHSSMPNVNAKVLNPFYSYFKLRGYCYPAPPPPESKCAMWRCYKSYFLDTRNPLNCIKNQKKYMWFVNIKVDYNENQDFVYFYGKAVLLSFHQGVEVLLYQWLCLFRLISLVITVTVRKIVGMLNMLILTFRRQDVSIRFHVNVG